MLAEPEDTTRTRERREVLRHELIELDENVRRVVDEAAQPRLPESAVTPHDGRSARAAARTPPGRAAQSSDTARW
jgi:hypothetical protein